MWRQARRPPPTNVEISSFALRVRASAFAPVRSHLAGLRTVAIGPNVRSGAMTSDVLARLVFHGVPFRFNEGSPISEAHRSLEPP